MKKPFAILILVSAVLWACAHKAPPGEDTRKTVAETIPLTAANLKGHKILYKEGWYVVSSTDKALKYAKEKSITSSSGNLKRLAADVVKRSKDLKSDVTSDWADSYKQAETLLKRGTNQTGRIFTGTGELAADELIYAKDTFIDACKTFVRGNLSLKKRTENDFHAFRQIPGNYFGNLKSDFSNMNELSTGVTKSVSDAIGLSWEKSFNKAAEDFRAEYEQSGKRSNSLAALGDILSGYLKAFYGGFAKPAAKSVVEYSAKGTSNLVFLPGAMVVTASGRTIEATGLTLVCAAKTGYHVVTPTVEAGVMSGMALLSAAAAPVTLVGGAGVGVVNQVAFTSVAPVYGTGKAVTDTAVDSGKYVALVGYDIHNRNTHVVINHLSSALVLGYNALTAIPVHGVLFAADTAVFVAWDGPRLVVAAARGKIKSSKGNEEFSVGDLPAGTVVDLNKLRQQGGVSVDIITDDPEVINRVFEKMPDDMRETDEK
jgi:hypothetical protein